MVAENSTKTPVLINALVSRVVFLADGETSKRWNLIKKSWSHQKRALMGTTGSDFILCISWPSDPDGIPPHGPTNVLS